MTVLAILLCASVLCNLILFDLAKTATLTADTWKRTADLYRDTNRELRRSRR